MSERYDREEGSGTSWASVVFGWLAALGASLILSGIVGAIVATIFAALGFRGGAEAGTTSLVGLLITFFLSFLAGGYVAGRMASRSGTKHGLLVALIALVVTIVLALLVAAVATPLVNIPGVTFSNVPTNLPSDVPGLGIVLSISGVLVLIFMFVGGPSAANKAPGPVADARSGGAERAAGDVFLRPTLGKTCYRGYESETPAEKER